MNNMIHQLTKTPNRATKLRYWQATVAVVSFVWVILIIWQLPDILGTTKWEYCEVVAQQGSLSNLISLEAKVGDFVPAGAYTDAKITPLSFCLMKGLPHESQKCHISYWRTNTFRYCRVQRLEL